MQCSSNFRTSSMRSPVRLFFVCSTKIATGMKARRTGSMEQIMGTSRSWNSGWRKRRSSGTRSSGIRKSESRNLRIEQNMRFGCGPSRIFSSMVFFYASGRVFNKQERASIRNEGETQVIVDTNFRKYHILFCRSVLAQHVTPENPVYEGEHRGRCRRADDCKCGKPCKY